MAIRHKKAILSSGYKSQALIEIAHYLECLAKHLDSREFLSEELAHIESNLEIIELFLVQLWISPPYNEILFIQRNLDRKQQEVILNVLEESKKQRRHLKLAA
jgi:hypothetical protein